MNTKQPTKLLNPKFYSLLNQRIYLITNFPNPNQQIKNYFRNQNQRIYPNP